MSGNDSTDPAAPIAPTTGDPGAEESARALLRETYHRIKNNLQGIAGLVQLQSRGRPELAPVLDAVAARIQALATVYGLQVRQDGEVVPLRLAETCLKQLTQTRGVSALVQVPERMACEAWRVSDNDAVALAMVMTELFSNAIRHRTAAGVTLEARADPGGLVFETINEGMLAADFDWARGRSATTGLGLVKAMLPRRGTSLSYRSGEGRVVAELRLGDPVIVRAQNESGEAVSPSVK